MQVGQRPITITLPREGHSLCTKTSTKTSVWLILLSHYMSFSCPVVKHELNTIPNNYVWGLSSLAFLPQSSCGERQENFLPYCLCLAHPCFHPSVTLEQVSWPFLGKGKQKLSYLTLIQDKTERRGTGFPLTSDFAFSKSCAMFPLSSEIQQKAREPGDPGVHAV